MGEILFTKTMERFAKDHGWTWTRNIDAINETYNYVLMLKDDGIDLRYNIYPDLGWTSTGVAAKYQTSFQFICTYAEIGGEIIPQGNLTQWSQYISMDISIMRVQKTWDSIMTWNVVRPSEKVRLVSFAITWTLTWKTFGHFGR